MESPAEQKLLIYSNLDHNRIRYIIKEIFGRLLGLDYIYTNDKSSFDRATQPKFEYITSTNLSSRWGEGDIPDDDLLQLSFRYLALVSEYNPQSLDEHGRFLPEQYISRPVVNHFAKEIGARIREQYPDIPFHEPEFEAMATVDIDSAWVFRQKGIFRNIGGLVNDVTRLKPEPIIDRVLALSGLQNDPYDVYEWLKKFHEEHDIPLYFFWLLGDYSDYDKNIIYNNFQQQNLIRQLALKYAIGIHPSYHSLENPDLIYSEVRRLADILSATGKKVEHSRQHFLRMQVPATYRALIAAGIRYDYTLGYAFDTGYRAGICTPFHWYDLENEEETDLIIVPFVAMDVTLKNKLQLSIPEAITHLAELAEEIYSVGGNYITIWHNESLSDYGEWKGWRNVYIQSMEYAAGLKKREGTLAPSGV